MNGSTFATSQAAGSLVLALAVLGILAIVVAMWTVDRWREARRLTRARDLQLQRARRHRVSVMAPFPTKSGAAQSGLASGAERARRAGVDEMVIDDLALWAQRSR